MQGSRRAIPRAELVKAGLLDESGAPAGSGAPRSAADAEALASAAGSVAALARRMDALEVWVLRALQQASGSSSD